MRKPIQIIAITGGIGSGKSVVSQLLHTMGYTVYDCDERAKWLMTHDPLLREQLIKLFGPDTYLSTADGSWQLNKPHLSGCIFGHPEALAQMDACVHPAVARDIQQQVYLAGKRGEHLFFYESAILYESGFDQLSPPDTVWTVSAPLETRISRAMQRDHADRNRILSRIDAQMPQQEKERRADHTIINDDHHSIVAQVNHIMRIS